MYAPITQEPASWAAQVLYALACFGLGLEGAVVEGVD